MDKKMMICNRANECGWTDCVDRMPHPQDYICADNCKILTDAKCIPYVEPSPAKDKCPECGHGIDEHNGYGFWLRDKPSVYCSCRRTFTAPQPEPMPLIDLRKQIESIGHEWLDLPIGGKDLNAFITLIMRTITAHDQQVRKDFAEEVCKLLDNELRIISPNTEAKLKAHLRAMAGER